MKLRALFAKRLYRGRGQATGRQLQILSDLHLEVGQQYAKFTPPVTAPYLVLAGDIGRLIDYDALLHGFLERIVPQYSRVFYVLGNHEFYGLTYDAGIETARKLEAEPSLLGKLTLLHCNKWEELPVDRDHGETGQSRPLTIVGCTLWSSVPPDAEAIVQSKIGDFRKITDWTVTSHNERHAHEASWLRSEVEQLAGRQPGERGPVCVITHHAPSLTGTSSPRNAENPWTSGFETELLGGSGSQSFWSSGVDLWVFGHTHHCVDEVCHGVRIVANQRGYVLGDGVSRGNVEAAAQAFDPGMTVGI